MTRWRRSWGYRRVCGEISSWRTIRRIFYDRLAAMDRWSTRPFCSRRLSSSGRKFNNVKIKSKERESLIGIWRANSINPATQAQSTLSWKAHSDNWAVKLNKPSRWCKKSSWRWTTCLLSAKHNWAWPLISVIRSKRWHRHLARSWIVPGCKRGRFRF